MYSRRNGQERKDDQDQAEKEYVQCRNRIGNNTFHTFKIKKPPVNKRFIKKDYTVRSFLTEFIKGLNQVFGNHFSGPAFNMVSFDHMNELSISEKGHAR